MKIVYQTTHDGLFVSEVVADESPLEPGVYLIPAGCVETAPPVAPDGFFVRWVDDKWVVEAHPDPEPEPEPPTDQEILDQARALAKLTRPELAFQMGKLGFLPLLEDRKAFSRGEIPQTLENLVNTVVSANNLDEEEEEHLLLVMSGGTEFPRVDPFWDMAVSAGIVTETQLDQAFGIET
jgi:hypothetical protein